MVAALTVSRWLDSSAGVAYVTAIELGRERFGGE
jgi:hypothetical protein